MVKIIAHIDLNYFFVRAEEIKNPTLEGKAVAIGNTGRGGIVSTCSYKARKYGVKSGMPMFQATKLCPNLIVINPDFYFYEALSNEFFAFVEQYSKLIEKASIDECYVDLTEYLSNYKDPITFFDKFQKDLYNKTKLKCSIGVSTTKFLAKMGSDLKKPMGITIIRKKDIEKLLFNNAIETYYGIGKSTSKLLKECGINTIGDLYYSIKNNDERIFKIIGKFKNNIISELEATSNDIVQIQREDSKSISCKETLPYNMNSKDELKEYLIKTFNEVYKRFKKEEMLCGGIEISFRYVDLKTQTFSYKLLNLTDNEKELKNEILNLFENHYKNQLLRQIGCAFERLETKHNNPIQMSLFNYEYYQEEDETLEIINNYNRHLKNTKLTRASDLLNKE